MQRVGRCLLGSLAGWSDPSALKVCSRPWASVCFQAVAKVERTAGMGALPSGRSSAQARDPNVRSQPLVQGAEWAVCKLRVC